MNFLNFAASTNSATQGGRSYRSDLKRPSEEVKKTLLHEHERPAGAACPAWTGVAGLLRSFRPFFLDIRHTHLHARLHQRAKRAAIERLHTGYCLDNAWRCQWRVPEATIWPRLRPMGLGCPLDIRQVVSIIENIE